MEKEVSTAQFLKEKKFFSMTIGEPEYLKEVIEGKEIVIPSWGTKNHLQITNENWEQYKFEFLESKLNIENPIFLGCTYIEKIKILLSILPIIETAFYSTLFNRYINLLETEYNKPLPPQPINKQKEETPKTFDELFYNTDLVTPCIDILKELDPPLIDTDCNYIGKLKGVICVWINEMQRQGIVKSNYPEERKLFALLIPQKIKRFSIDESMFGKHQNKAEYNHRTDIKAKVSKIKLSQNSH